MKQTFKEGEIYRMQYNKPIPTRVWRGTNNVAESELRTISGNYEYIGRKGNRMHFFDNEAGVDLLCSKVQAFSYLLD
jgi:hypothetical protein